eukprot:m.1176 g.1176  ORF g.1176 m.1176 type:complete len:590 (-) comp572_c0_seq1:129-1898(-)
MVCTFSGCSRLATCSVFLVQAYLARVATAFTITGWVTALPTTAQPGYVLPLSIDGAISGWVCDLDDPTTPLVLQFAIGGKFVGNVTADGLFYNDGDPPPIAPPAPSILHLNFNFFVPDAVLVGRNVNQTLSMIAVNTATGESSPFVPGLAAQARKLLVNLRPRLSPFYPALGSACLGDSRCLSKGDALSFGAPWFDTPTGWADDSSTSQDLFKEWNCSAPSGGVNTIVRLNILPYARRVGAAIDSPGDRYHHRGFKKDSLHLSESERDPWGGPVLHFSAARYGIPGLPGSTLGRAAQTASAWSLKKAIFNRTSDAWEVFDQLDSPTSDYGISSYDGVDGVNMIMNDGGVVGWGPTATCSPTLDQRCKIPSLATASAADDIPSYPLVGTGPLGLTTIQNYHHNTSTRGVAARCIHMNPKLAEFDDMGVPHVMWAYLWTTQPDVGCVLPSGEYVRAGYYAYRINKTDVSSGWQLDLTQGLAEFNQTRGQAMKKEWGATQQTSFIFSCWDLPPNLTPPSTIFRVDTTWPTPRYGEPLLQCYGSNSSDKVHLGEATGNSTDLYFLVDFDAQVSKANTIGEKFSADIYYAYRST